MLVPLSWLREFVPYEGTAGSLGDKLTMLGLELEDIINPFAGIRDIKVGFVSQCVEHPDSDHMHCCKVDLGTGELLDIVCGAPNVAQGQKVAVAPVGAVLPDGTRIKKAKLRGQPSFGMICSERELGLSDDHGGILVLPESADVGHSLIDAFNLDTEVLNLSITPNRSDCLSILGIARETAVAYNLPLHVPDLPLILDQRDSEIEVPIQIEDPDLCWLYAGRVITNVSVAPSAFRLRCRLYAVGVRAISNLVDVTNYILFEVGQPLHSFDLDKLEGGSVIVRKAKAGERLVTLDGKDRQLEPDDLCICDAHRPVALAGVMGGLDSEITASTRNVFLESAVFRPQNIRKTSRRLGLQSEASYRFERGVDQRRSIWALDRACSMMATMSGGYVRRGFSLNEPRPFKPVHISYRPARANEILGVEIDSQYQQNILSALGCAVEMHSQNTWIVMQPSWRPDLTREADLVEEVGREYGMDAIEPRLPAIRRSLDDNLASASSFDFWQLVKRWGAGLGLYEAINYSFIGQKDLDFLGLPKEGRLSVFNPLSSDQDTMRTCLAPGLLADLANNLAFGTQSIRLFELANAFESDKESETGARETGLVGVLLSGARHEIPWPHVNEDLDYSDIKGVLENLAGFLHLAMPGLEQVKDHPWLSPCVNVKFGGIPCGYMGRVKPAIAREYHAQKPVWMLELQLDVLASLHKEAMVQFHPLPSFPAIRRDMTVQARAGIRAEEILEKIQLTRLPLLEGAVLVDCMEENTTRNLTFRLVFRHPERTLKDEEADKMREQIADALRRDLNVEI